MSTFINRKYRDFIWYKHLNKCGIKLENRDFFLVPIINNSIYLKSLLRYILITDNDILGIEYILIFNYGSPHFRIDKFKDFKDLVYWNSIEENEREKIKNYERKFQH